MLDRDTLIQGLKCCVESDESGMCPDLCPVRYVYADCENELKKELLRTLTEERKDPDPGPRMAFCPLTENGSCGQGECAWWDHVHDCCAIHTIAKGVSKR